MPRPAWPAAKIELLSDLWARGVPLKTIMQRVGLRNEATVYSTVQRLRTKGYVFPHRYRGGSITKPSTFGVAGDGLVIPTTPGHVIQAARILDADGTVIATMDPATRARRAV